MRQPSLLQRLTSYRSLAGLLTLASIIGMSFAYYLQKVEMLDPCPLCIFQRIGLIAMGIFALIAFLLNPKKLWARLGLMFGALLGMLWSVGVATRHVWLQHLHRIKYHHVALVSTTGSIHCQSPKSLRKFLKVQASVQLLIGHGWDLAYQNCRWPSSQCY